MPTLWLELLVVLLEKGKVSMDLKVTFLVLELVNNLNWKLRLKLMEWNESKKKKRK